MAIGNPELKAGIGAFIVAQESSGLYVATIRELTTKKSTRKLANMRSILMETVEEGETHEDTYRRGLQEELVIDGLDRDHPLTKTLLCRAELAPGIILYSYLTEVSKRLDLATGTHAKEVDNPRWVSINEIFTNPAGSLRFRPGVFETALSYRRYQEHGKKFRHLEFSHDEILLQIPDSAFEEANRLSA